MHKIGLVPINYITIRKLTCEGNLSYNKLMWNIPYINSFCSMYDLFFKWKLFCCLTNLYEPCYYYTPWFCICIGNNSIFIFHFNILVPNCKIWSWLLLQQHPRNFLSFINCLFCPTLFFLSSFTTYLSFIQIPTELIAFINVMMFLFLFYSCSKYALYSPGISACFLLILRKSFDYV